MQTRAQTTMRVAIVAAALLGTGASAAAPTPSGGVPRETLTSADTRLRLEFLDDDLVHFEFMPRNAEPKGPAIAPTPMVAKRDYAGPSEYERQNRRFMTADLIVTVEAKTLCVSTYRQGPGDRLTRICPKSIHSHWKQLSFSQEKSENVYGLGEQFREPGDANGDWLGEVRTPGGVFGNKMVGYEGGAVGNAQFPVYYALGDDGFQYALFLDHAYKQRWDFRADPWTVGTWGERVRGYLMTGPDLIDVRSDFMELVGRPPVPPRKAFGLWVSEYGYDDWGEVEETLEGLRKTSIPVDGFVLDLQWFGGVVGNSDMSPMGSLTWDRKNFPNPKERISRFRQESGISFMTIEESYVSRGLSEHETLAERGALVTKSRDGEPVYLTSNPWWGRGGMLDWSDLEAADFWHDWKRQPLIDAGIIGHWTDLGEPEMYDSDSWYAGHPDFTKHTHAANHNLYNLLWHESIARGYDRNGVERRPFLMSRSGTVGLQRFGASMWSGDIGSNLRSLATHMNAQMHMSFSGIDYFGSDVGGFHRSALDGDLNEMYTQWFANSALLDVPLRPHTENLCNCKVTSPAQIGHVASNRANTKLRYRLIPYLYSWAHRAHNEGLPVFPPLVFYYPDDPAVREMGHEKMLGDSLVMGIVARHGERKRDMYLPDGRWYDYYSLEKVHSKGEWIRSIPEYRDGIFRVPLYAKAGTIVPEYRVTGDTRNLGDLQPPGKRGAPRLDLKVFDGHGEHSFTLFQDDGKTTAYQKGAVRRTRISHQSGAKRTKIHIHPAEGTYAGASSKRHWRVTFVTKRDSPTSVSLDGRELTQVLSRQGLRQAASGWYRTRQGTVLVKPGRRPVSEKTRISLLWPAES